MYVVSFHSLDLLTALLSHKDIKVQMIIRVEHVSVNIVRLVREGHGIAMQECHGSAVATTCMLISSWWCAKIKVANNQNMCCNVSELLDKVILK